MHYLKSFRINLNDFQVFLAAAYFHIIRVKILVIWDSRWNCNIIVMKINFLPSQTNIEKFPLQGTILTVIFTGTSSYSKKGYRSWLAQEGACSQLWLRAVLLLGEPGQIRVPPFRVHLWFSTFYQIPQWVVLSDVHTS